jgi:hypothetical protein
VALNGFELPTEPHRVGSGLGAGGIFAAKRRCAPRAGPASRRARPNCAITSRRREHVRATGLVCTNASWNGDNFVVLQNKKCNQGLVEALLVVAQGKLEFYRITCC